jgi:cardiolipin synthase
MRLDKDINRTERLYKIFIYLVLGILAVLILVPVLWVLVCLFFVKECFQLIAGLLTLRKGQMLNGAHISGKICTTVLFVSLIVLVMMPQLNDRIVGVITVVDCIVVLIAFVCYARVYYTHSPMIQDLSKKEE